MRLVFRADASPILGSGHVMRCSSIAEEAIARGVTCIFVGSMGGIDWLEERLNYLGVPVSPVSEFVNFGKNDLLILDSYSRKTQDDFINLYDWELIVEVVDEVTPLQKADLYIHPGLDGSWFRGNQEKFLYGAPFIPFRKGIKKREVLPGERIEKIVIFGGGTDTFEFAQEMSRILCLVEGFTQATFFSSNCLDFEKVDGRFRGYQFGKLLDFELAQADLVFTTASTSSLEIVAREIPLGVACSVENQESNYEALADFQVAVPIGDRIRSDNWQLDFEKIRNLVINPDLRKKMFMASKNFIDLNGASRILDRIVSL